MVDYNVLESGIKSTGRVIPVAYAISPVSCMYRVRNYALYNCIWRVILPYNKLIEVLREYESDFLPF